MNKLVRTIDNKVLAGVCGGLGNYFGLDPVVIRAAFAIGTVMGFGATIPIYIVLAIVMPSDDPIL